MNDTICAISTALGVGAISIIRVSGDEAIDIVNKIFDKDLTKKEDILVKYESFVDMNSKDLYGLIKEKYDKVYYQELQQKTTLIGVHRDDFSIYLDNLKQFIVFKNMHSPKLPINLRLWNDKSKKEINDLNQKIEDTINDWLNEQDYQNIRFSYADEFVWPNLNSDIVLPYTNCLGAKKQIAILIDGSVVSCCLDHNGNTKIGNIFEEPFDTILNSQLFKNVVRGFCDKKPYFEICKKCSYRLRFK